MDIGKVFERGWKLFVKDVAPYVIGALILAALSVVTIGILYGPLSAGLYVMAVRRVRQNRTAEIGDVFWGLSHFWRFFGAALLLLILIGIGFVFLIVPGLLLATIWIYVFPVMVDRDMGVFDAMAESRRLVRENGFGQHFVMVLLLIALSIAGSIAGGLGHLLTLPLTFTIVTAMYFAACREEDLLRAAIDAAGRPAAAAWQPAAPPVTPDVTPTAAPTALPATADAPPSVPAEAAPPAAEQAPSGEHSGGQMQPGEGQTEPDETQTQPADVPPPPEPPAPQAPSGPLPPAPPAPPRR
jgi:hypothetical protein